MYIGSVVTDESLRYSPKASLCDDSIRFDSRAFVQRYGNRSGDMIVVKATLVTDQSKSLMVEISTAESVFYLKQVIGDMMKNRFAAFKKLDCVRAI